MRARLLMLAVLALTAAARADSSVSGARTLAARPLVGPRRSIDELCRGGKCLRLARSSRAPLAPFLDATVVDMPERDGFMVALRTARGWYLDEALSVAVPRDVPFGPLTVDPSAGSGVLVFSGSFGPVGTEDHEPCEHLMIACSIERGRPMCAPAVAIGRDCTRDDDDVEIRASGAIAAGGSVYRVERAGVNATSRGGRAAR
jgi:hypothetical protein